MKYFLIIAVIFCNLNIANDIEINKIANELESMLSPTSCNSTASYVFSMLTNGRKIDTQNFTPTQADRMSDYLFNSSGNTFLCHINDETNNYHSFIISKNNNGYRLLHAMAFTFSLKDWCVGDCNTTSSHYKNQFRQLGINCENELRYSQENIESINKSKISMENLCKSEVNKRLQFHDFKSKFLLRLTLALKTQNNEELLKSICFDNSNHNKFNISIIAAVGN